MGTVEEGLTGIRPPMRAWLRALPLERRGEFRRVDLEGDGLGASVPIPCGGAVHAARVEGDHFVLADHDADAELALVVLGAEPPPCLLYEAVWDGAAHDTFLAEWAGDPDDDRLTKAAEDWYGNYWESWPAEPSAARVLFGPRLQRAAAVAAARSWVARRGADGPGSAWADVRRAVATRARRAIVLSLASVDAHRRPDALVPVRVTVAPDREPSLAGVLSRHASAIDVRLPVRWLWEVWITTGGIDRGRFVLDANSVVEWVATGGRGREHRPVNVLRPG